MKPVSEELLKYAEFQNPKSRMILETVIVTSEDIKDARQDWDAADSVTGWDRLQEGGARPAGSTSDKIAYATGTDDSITSLPGISGATVGVVAIRWSPNQSDEHLQNISGFTARLDPDASGGGTEVTKWVGQLFRVAEVEDDVWRLEPISKSVSVTAGAVVAEVTFSIPGVASNIGVPPVGETRPITVMVVQALKGAGEIASNVAWIGNNAISSVSSGNHTITRYNLLEIANQDGSETLYAKAIQSASGVPRFTIKGQSYSQQTIQFTGSNAPTLAATPVGTVEFMLEHEQPGGSSGVGYARNNGSTTWVAFTDGQTTTDLGLSTTGPQYEMRYIASPSTSGFMVPTVRRLGVREVSRTNVDGIGRVGDPTYTLDPLTMKAGIPVLPIEITKDGARDYRDFATELLSDNHAGQVEFDVYYGHPDLNRQYWTYIDRWRIRNYESGGGAIQIEAIHPLALTKKTIPAGSTSGQNAIVYTGSTDTTETVYAGILNECGLAGRYKGALLATTSAVNIAKKISEPRPAKDELDRIAFIEGGAIIPSGGRLKWKRIWTSTGGLLDSPVEHFDNVTPISVSPNLDRRIVSYRVPYGWNDGYNENRGGFAGTVYQSSTSAVSKLGHAVIDPQQDLDRETAEWLISDSTGVGSVYGDAIARRTVGAFRQGMVLLRFRPDHPRPWLELGDVVEVKTDSFVGRGLETDRALRGRFSITGPIISHNMSGTEFTVWAPEVEKSLPATDNIAIDYGKPTLSIVGIKAIPIGATTKGDDAWAMELDLDVGIGCNSVRVQPFLNMSRQESTGGSTPFTFRYNYNVDPGERQSMRIKYATLGQTKGTNPPGSYATENTADFEYIVQNTTSGPISDTDDDGAILFGPNSGRLLMGIFPQSLAATTATPHSGVGVSGARQDIWLPSLRKQGSPTTAQQGAKSYAGSAFRISTAAAGGIRLVLSSTTDGIPFLSLST